MVNRINHSPKIHDVDVQTLKQIGIIRQTVIVY